MKQSQHPNNPFDKIGTEETAVSPSVTPVKEKKTIEILFLTSFPPRECGIATYSLDLVTALNNKFSQSFRIRICPLESANEQHHYTAAPGQERPGDSFLLNTDSPGAFSELAKQINDSPGIELLVIQHEFGFFKQKEEAFSRFLSALHKPVILVFHTVLPGPDKALREHVVEIAGHAAAVVVMTHAAESLLVNDYGIATEKIDVIPHGTHLVPHPDKDLLKYKYNLSGRTVLATFGLLSSGKGIETTLEALPAIIAKNPDVLFLVIGKTHPTVIKEEGEKYRQLLEAKVAALHLEEHVRFINRFLPLPDLLEYLQSTDIYLFTSRNPNQAVSGTFAYAMSCGCPVISTPIPHALEVLKDDAGVIVDFGNSEQLAAAVSRLWADAPLRKNISSNGLHRMASTAWENAAIAHALLFEKIAEEGMELQYNLPEINLDHIKKLTTRFGMIQFSNLNQPDPGSGYTLDDNARALVAFCQYFEQSGDPGSLKYIRIYLDFIAFCQQPGGMLLNYVDVREHFTEQNQAVSLADANGRAVWALGYLLSLGPVIPIDMETKALSILQGALISANRVHSTRAMAFIIKGLCYRLTTKHSARGLSLVKQLANRLVQMYRHETNGEWNWFESYLTYANSILPEALLCAWQASGDPVYKEIARSSFDFLLSKTFDEKGIRVISNKNWLHKGSEQGEPAVGGEQPIDVAYTILALSRFYTVFRDESYRQKMDRSFEWFLGNNYLHQIIYNPCTGGCYDGLEDNYVNLNQGAESAVSYLMARMTMEKNRSAEQEEKNQLEAALSAGVIQTA